MKFVYTGEGAEKSPDDTCPKFTDDDAYHHWVEQMMPRPGDGRKKHQTSEHEGR